ncbi:unnamed protein product [Heterobilharzia americana]|nr:unnamed protein product [Heterobilharzia americana]
MPKILHNNPTKYSKSSRKDNAFIHHKETELLQIIESLRVKKHELEIFSANHESAMRKQITELRIMLQSAQIEINELKQNLHIVQTTTATIKSFNSMSTSTNFETYKIAKSNNNNNNLVNLSKVNNIETSPSTEPTMVTRSISVEENFSNNHNDNDSSHHDRQQSHHHRPSPSGSEASLDNSHNNNNSNNNNNNNQQQQQQIKPNNSNHVTHMYQMDSNSSNNYNQSNHYHDQPPMKPQRKGLDQKSNNLLSPCTPQNLTSSKHLANQATSYLSELFKLVSNLAQNSKISRLANIHEDVYKKNSITIYPIGWKFSYYPIDVTICDDNNSNLDDNSMKRETVETIFNDHIFRTCYLANISMKAEGICTNSQDFFTIYSNQLPEIWLNALNKYKYSQNFFNENDTSSNSLHLNHTVRSKLVSDLHHLGLLSAFNNETKQIDNNIHMNNYENDNHDNDNDDDDDDNIVNESKILKSKLIQYLLYINLNPLITQRILNELHYTLQHLSIINNDNNNDKINKNFIVMNSLTIELFNTMNKVLKKYFNKLNIKLPTILFNNDEDDNYESNNELHRWSYIQAILQINLIKFTIIEELKIINEAYYDFLLSVEYYQ